MDGRALPPGLPPGRLVVPQSSPDGGRIYTEPVLWVSDEPQAGAGDLWAELLASRAATGLWPLLLLGIHVGERIRAMMPPELVREHTYRPWHVGEIEPVPVEGIADVSVGQVLARWWREAVTGPAGETFDFGEDALPKVPFPQWPGLAMPSGAAAADPDMVAARIVRSPGRRRELTGRDDPPYVGLVPAADGAAAMAACGWPSSALDLTEAAAVVRSWQDRFGARVCVLGINTLVMTVARPPDGFAQARRVAAEHLALLKSFVVDFDEYAKELIGDQVWFFWWD